MKRKYLPMKEINTNGKQMLNKQQSKTEKSQISRYARNKISMRTRSRAGTWNLIKSCSLNVRITRYSLVQNFEFWVKIWIEISVVEIKAPLYYGRWDKPLHLNLRDFFKFAFISWVILEVCQCFWGYFRLHPPII